MILAAEKKRRRVFGLILEGLSISNQIIGKHQVGF
jgi:hypothetical protein